MKKIRIKKIFEGWKNLTNKSIKHKIFGAAITVGLLTSFVKLAAIGKELITAWIFGITDELDAFLIAFVVPSLLVNVIASSFNAALIPTYIKVREQEGKKAAQKLFSGANLWSLLLLIVTTILMLITAPVYLPWIALGFNTQKLELTFHLLYALAPIVTLSGIFTTWSAILNAGEHFALAALCPIMTPTITIIFLVWFKSWGVFTLTTGLIVGGVLEIILVGVTLHQQGISLLPKWYGFDSHLRQVASQYLPMIAGALLICSASSIDQVMAAMLSPGSVSALNYGNRVIASPISLMSTALSTAVMPYFSKMVACQDWTGVNKTLKYYLQFIFITTVPITLLLLMFSEPIVRILFQRGSFSSDNTHLVAQIQFFYTLQIPFYLANILVVRLISSLQKNHILMWVSGCNLIINIALNYFLIQYMGIKGIAFSTSCIYVFSFFFTFFSVKNVLQKQSGLK